MHHFSSIVRAGCAVAALLVASHPALADKPAAPSAEEMQKMMEKFKQLCAPGPQHAALARMAGEWVTASKMWWAPGTEPETTTGSSYGEMIFGGRFLTFDDHGTVMGQPFSGKGQLGYDNFKGKYWMSWIDDMGTGFLTAEGSSDPNGRVITLLGKMDDPMTGQKGKDVKYVMRWIDENTRLFEIYDAVGTPQEFKTLEITYSRKM